MRGKMIRKNVIKDYFIRTYAAALVMIAFLLFVDVMLFIISRGAMQSGEGTEYFVKNFSFMGGNLLMAIAFPAIMFWMFLGGCFDRGAGDLYQSLPSARAEMFGSAVCVITGYEGVFLLLQMILRLILVAVTKGCYVRRYFYGSVIGLSLAIYLVFLGITILCFCASASTYGFIGRVALWVILLWMLKDGICAVFFTKQMLYFDREFNVSGTLAVKIGDAWQIIAERLLFDDLSVDTYVSAWELGVARDAGLFMAVFGALLLVMAWFLFRKRPAERTNGRNRSEAMHVCMQAVAFGSALMDSLGFMEDYQYQQFRNMVNHSEGTRLALTVLKKGAAIGIPVLLFFCVWEALYRKNIREVWKVWKGILLGTLLGAVGAVLAFAAL